ncbi:MAG: hypothetical protein IKQ94_10800 [Bacteroidales bacterium]|nr:hypothetical protein [Bacteroidales bacterium]
MALNKEIWVNDIVENFFPDDSFVKKSRDHSAFVEGKTVHVPNAGSPAQVTKNLNSFPATVGSRTDNDLSYDMGVFYAAPIVLNKAEDVELSYDKRSSITSQSKAALLEAVSADILHNWVPATSPVKVATTGSNATAHIHGATGNRKKIVLADIKAVKKIFDANNVPQADRFILLDSEMYNQLLDAMTDAATLNFLAGADPEQGILGKYMGFSFMMRSQVLKTASDGTLKDWLAANEAATDCAAGLAWQKDCVSHAMGSVEAYTTENDPAYYGDVLSYNMRAGGAPCRYDKKGVVLIYQG